MISFLPSGPEPSDDGGRVRTASDQTEPLSVGMNCSLQNLGVRFGSGLISAQISVSNPGSSERGIAFDEVPNIRSDRERSRQHVVADQRGALFYDARVLDDRVTLWDQDAPVEPRLGDGLRHLRVIGGVHEGHLGEPARVLPSLPRSSVERRQHLILE